MKENKRETPEKGSKISPIRIDQELLEDPKMDEMIRESLKQEADDLDLPFPWHVNNDNLRIIPS